MVYIFENSCLLDSKPDRIEEMRQKLKDQIAEGCVLLPIDMRLVKVVKTDSEAMAIVQEWISCEDELPEVYEKVITFEPSENGGRIRSNFRLNLKDGSVSWSNGFNITHWMPMIEPPEGGDDNG